MQERDTRINRINRRVWMPIAMVISSFACVIELTPQGQLHAIHIHQIPSSPIIIIIVVTANHTLVCWALFFFLSFCSHHHRILGSIGFSKLRHWQASGAVWGRRDRSAMGRFRRWLLGCFFKKRKSSDKSLQRSQF